MCFAVKKSLFITFEGGEGAGKTTLIEEIAGELSKKEIPFIKTREPGGTPLGEEVRKLLLGDYSLSHYTELCLFLASRAQHIAEVIKPALEAGKIVLCDRFNDSSIAYQGAARNLGETKVSEFCSFISEGLEPDLTFYLDLDPEVGLKRIQRSRDRIEAESIAFHTKIREAFHRLAKHHPGRLKILDASESAPKVFARAMELVYNKL